MFDPEATGALNNRGNAYHKLGMLKEALNDYSAIIQITNKDYDAYYNRANIKVDLGEYDDAINDFKKAIELNPKMAEAYHNNGPLPEISKPRSKGQKLFISAPDILLE